jgi:hypothetical protein
MRETKFLGLMAIVMAAGCGGAGWGRGGEPPSLAPLNPLERQTEMQWLRVQLRQKVGEGRSSRPALERRLREMGYDGREIAVIFE